MRGVTHRAHRALRDGAEQVLGRRYAHDAAGRVSAIDDFRSGASRYTYDPADRLLRVQGLAAEDFVHDPAGNLLGSPTDGGRVEGNRLLMLGDRHFRCDSAGNRVEENGAAAAAGSSPPSPTTATTAWYAPTRPMAGSPSAATRWAGASPSRQSEAKPASSTTA